MKFCGSLFLRPFSKAPRTKEKHEPLSKNGNCRIVRKTKKQFLRGHSTPLHCIPSIPFHSLHCTALHRFGIECFPCNPRQFKRLPTQNSACPQPTTDLDQVVVNVACLVNNTEKFQHLENNKTRLRQGPSD